MLALACLKLPWHSTKIKMKKCSRKSNCHNIILVVQLSFNHHIKEARCGTGIGEGEENETLEQRDMRFSEKFTFEVGSLFEKLALWAAPASHMQCRDKQRDYSFLLPVSPHVLWSPSPELLSGHPQFPFPLVGISVALLFKYQLTDDRCMTGTSCPSPHSLVSPSSIKYS